jgi:hypothetical protein
VAVPQSASAAALPPVSSTTASITFVNSSSSNSSNQGFAATSKNQDPIAAIAGDVLTVTVTLTNPTATTYTPVFTFPKSAGNLSGGIDVNGECPPTNSTCATLNSGTSGTQTLLVQVPAGALSGDLTLTEISAGDYFRASTPIHIWASNGEPYVMPNGHLNISLEDLKVMLDQAKIAEAHAARTATTVSTLYRSTDAPLSQSLYPYNVTTADRCLTVGDLINATTATNGPTGLSNIYPFNTIVQRGMRQVDVECNNIS